MNESNQSGGVGSKNTQIIYNGLSVNDAMQIAKSLVEANFEKLQALAGEIADERIAKFREEIFKALSSKQDLDLRIFEQPHGQIALFEAQKGFAISGERNHLDILVKLVADLAVKSERTIDTISLEEAIKQVALLMPQQLNALGIIFTFRFFRVGGIQNLEDLVAMFQRHCLDRLLLAPITFFDLNHLEYCRCGARQFAMNDFIGAIVENYRGIFQVPLSEREMTEAFGGFIPHGAVIEHYAGNGLRISAMSDEEVDKLAELNFWSKEQKDTARRLLNSQTQPREEVLQMLFAKDGRFQSVSEIWQSSGMNSFVLSNVGLILGHTVCGFESAINTWMR